MDFYRLGTMVHLDIQKLKEDMKALEFHKNIVGTAACMKRLMVDTKKCSQLTSNDT